MMKAFKVVAGLMTFRQKYGGQNLRNDPSNRERIARWSIVQVLINSRRIGGKRRVVR